MTTPASHPLDRRTPEGTPLTVFRRFAEVVAVLILAAAALGMIARWLPVTNHVVLIVTVVGPFLLVGGPLALAAFVAMRRWVAAALAVLVVAATLVVETPSLLGPPDTAADDPQLRVVTANLYFGEADAEELVSSVAAGADVLAVQEMTPDAAARLSAAGIDELLPHRFLRPGAGATGGGVWSRYPLVAKEVVAPYALTTLQVTIRPADVPRPVTLLSVHPVPPWPEPIDGWRRELADLRTTLTDVAQRAGDDPVVVAGDFNSTRSMRPFRQLLANGYRDAAEQAGVPYAMTFPSDFRTPPPPFMAIDHVLVRNATATALHAVTVTGTDHRALVATVRFPR